MIALGTLGTLGTFFASTAGRYLLGVVAILALLGTLYACGVQEGRGDARVESIERTLEAVETRREVEDTVAREPDPVGSLLDGWARD